MLDHQTVVGGQVRLALGSVDNQEFGLLSRRGRQLDMGREGSNMGREGSTAQTHYAAIGDSLYNLGMTEGYLTHNIGCAVDALLPLVSLHVYHHVHHGVAGQVGVWLDGGYCTGY